MKGVIVIMRHNFSQFLCNPNYMTKSILFKSVTLCCCFYFLSLSVFSQYNCIDSSISFNGNQQYLKLAPNQFSDTNFLTALKGDYTIECLIKWRGGADFQRIFDFSYGTNFFMFLTTSENNNHVPRFAISVTGLSAPQIVDANIPLIPDVYHHIAITYSKANSLVTIFIDGINSGSGTINIDADSVYYGSDMHDSSANYIGLSSFLGDPQLNADVDEFRISDTVRYTNNFSPLLPFVQDAYTVLLHHFDEGSGQVAADASGNNYNGQLGSTSDVDVNDPTRMSCSEVLASSLINFTATDVQSKITLNWQTVSETNAGYYEVQKSSDGEHFTDAAKINAYGKNTINKYSFIDVSPFSGNNFYRLKQVDKSGSFIYSKVVFIPLNRNNGFRIYPTVAQSRLHISATKTPSVFIIFNIIGKPLQTINMNSLEEDIDISNLSSGTYIIHSKDGSALKFIKQ